MADYDWSALQTEYVTTNTSYRKLAAKYNVPFTALRERAIKDKWFNKREQSRNRILTKSIEKAEENKIDYKSVLYDLAYSMAQKITEFASAHTVDEMVAMGIRIRDITGAIKDLEDSLHIKSENDLKEQEARIDKLRKDASTEQADTSIKVVISGDLEDYAD